jgi:hypothetical protein
MYHSIEFVGDLLVDVEVSRNRPLEHLLIRAGTRFRSQVKPYVVETDAGPVEVADLFFEDGTTTRRVPFACFSFVE